MTTERDELADLVANHTVDENSWCMAYDGRESSYCKCGEKLYPVRTLHRHLADAILAIGYRKPAVVTTAEELDALPSWSVVLVSKGHAGTAAAEKWPSGWRIPLRVGTFTSTDLLRGAVVTVLHRGDE
jgi:hypothetical protein